MSDSVQPYRVLARKYRPQNFGELIGQDAMVRTLANAIRRERLAHAFLLTGVRGVGKTSTARLIAKALNCVGTDGQGGPTIDPCGACEPCVAIAEGRHIDVVEMDAASHTGIDDVREIIEAVRYASVSARYKIYIIDEVHMLSKPAFNGLLKTLEEPPAHVKFLFATTEIQKVPITVLSRCQRFSLRRVPADILGAHYARISEAEGVTAEPAALGLIARAADGSVRDGLSILDQAIALGGNSVTETSVREMLGIADRGLVFDLLETVLKGDAASALQQMRSLYDGGADPLAVLQDLLDLTHFLTRLKVVPAAGEGDPTVEGDRVRGLPLAQKLGMPALTRAWQMILKGLGELQSAPSPLQAAEMVLVRLAYVADLPAPADLVKALTEGGSIPSRPPASAPMGGGGGGSSAMASAPQSASQPPRMVHETGSSGGARLALAPQPVEAEAPGLPQPQSFLEVLDLFDKHREALLRSHLWSHVHLVSFEPGRIEFRPTALAPRDLANKLGQLLGEWTGTRWVVTVSGAEGAATLKEQADAKAVDLRNEAALNPLVQAVLDTFPGARIEAVRELAQAAPEDTPAPAPPDPEDILEGDDF